VAGGPAIPGQEASAFSPLWTNTWSEFARLPAYDPEIRRVINSTNAIESLHARMRRATRTKGHFLNRQAAPECLSMVVRSLDPSGRGRRRRINRWKPALNAFAITFEGRLLPAGDLHDANPDTPIFRQS
jgi:putative transposase